MAGRVGLGPGRNIPADAGAGLGLFETLHDFASGAALADHIKAATGRLFGTAGRVLLERLAAEPEALAAAAQEAMARFLADRVPKGAAGQVQRAARRFALVAAGGEMAIALGILPWPKDEAERAAATCFEAWRAAREGGDGAAEDAMALAAVRHFIGTHDARFEVWEPKNSGGAAATAPGEVLPQREPHPVPNRAGWKKPDSEGWRYCILPETWRREVVPGRTGTPARSATPHRSGTLHRAGPGAQARPGRRGSTSAASKDVRHPSNAADRRCSPHLTSTRPRSEAGSDVRICPSWLAPSADACSEAGARTDEVLCADRSGPAHLTCLF